MLIEITVQPRQDNAGPLLQVTTQQRITVPDAGQQADTQPGEQAGQATEVEPPDKNENVPEHPPQPEEAQVPAGEGAQGQHHAGHHNERLHHLLAALLRAGPGPALLGDHPGIEQSEQRIPVAGLRQQSAQPDHLRHAQQGLQETLPGHPLLPVQ